MSPLNVTLNENYELSMDPCESKMKFEETSFHLNLYNKKKNIIVIIHLFWTYIVVSKKQRLNHVGSMVAVVEFCCGMKT